jgi:dTMP kinase
VFKNTLYFSNSSIKVAYQGYGREVDQEFLQYLYKYIVGDVQPDFTFVFDIDVDEGLKRATARMEGNTVIEGRFEAFPPIA